MVIYRNVFKFIHPLNLLMKLSDYAKKMGVTYRTAWNWFKSGKLNAIQMYTGTIIVKDEINDGIKKL